jgi:low temperature requirement protein LtrA
VTSGPAPLVRDPAGPQRATLLELFFDLVFVGSLALTSMTFAANVSWSGALHGLIPLIAVWWVWSITALLTDFYDPQRLPIQITLAGVMLGSILMAASLPTAFGKHGIVFAGAYVAIHLGRGLMLVTVLRGHLAQVRAARFMFWFGVSGVMWLIGALEASTTRAILWALALAVDLVAAGFRYPTPLVGRVPLDQYSKTGEHIGERYQQFMILALGDLILVATLGYSRTDLTMAATCAVLVTFATTVLLWQIYVERAGTLLLTFVTRKPGRILRWAPYTHMIMIIGTVFTAAGFDLVIARPRGHTPAAWLAFILGGPILFLIGRTTFEYEVFGRVSGARLASPVLLGALTPAMMLVPPLAVATVVAFVLLGLAITEGIRTHRRRPPSIVFVTPDDPPKI